MDFLSAIKGVVWPAVMTGTAARLLALQQQFDASQWWPADELRAHQFRQLQVLVEHAVRTVPFHAERLRAAGIDPSAPLTEASWARLPILTRRDVQEAGDRLHATELPAEHGETNIMTTGGSTGIPVRVRKSTLDGILWMAACIRDEIWHREDMSGTLARVRPMPPAMDEKNRRIVLSPEGLVVQTWGEPQSLLWRTGPMAIIDVTKPIPQQAEYLRRLNPDYLLTDPSNLRLLLGHCRDEAITLPALRSVWTVSEVVDPALRALCQRVFGVRTVENYSSMEVGYIALQCPDHTHLHVQSELVLVEVLDANGHACAPGETGRVVVTPLHNFAMPLLRYELGDEAEAGEPCQCGRGLPVLTRVVGRTIDHVTLPSGLKRPAVINHTKLSEFTAIREFQIVQRAVDLIEARFVVSRPLTDAEKLELIAVLQAEFHEGFRVELSFPDSIARTAAGKMRPFISDLA
jgi:phenylacetate-CoA ligase